MPQNDLAGNPLPDDPYAHPMQYDLAGNPIEPQPGAYAQTVPGPGGYYPPGTVPGGYRTQAPPTGFVPDPQPGHGTYSQGAGPLATSADQLVGRRSSDDLAQKILQNTSGTLTEVPPEIEKMRWNWGGFLLPAFWAFNNGFKWLAIALWSAGAILNLSSQVPAVWNDTLGVLFTFICLGVSIWFGICGNSLAWKMRRFEHGVDEFKDVQRIWMYAGVGVTLISVVVFGGKLSPGIAILDLSSPNKLDNIYRPVNYQITDYQIMYGHRPPLL